MHVPNWDEPIATARQEATTLLARGLPVRPTLVGFEGREPTLYVRSRMLTMSGHHPDMIIPEVLLLPTMLEISRLLIVSPVALSDIERDDADTTCPSWDGGSAGDVTPDHTGLTADDRVEEAAWQLVLAERAITVERVQHDEAGRINSSGELLPYRIDDHGRCAWEDPIDLPEGGLWAAAMRQQAREEEPADRADHRPDSLGPTEAAYALSRFGLTIAVAPTWRSRYGLDDRVDPRGVRHEDRRRARDLEARRTQTSTAGGRP